MRVLGSILGGFWEPKGLKKTIKILNAFWDAKKGAELIFRGPARRNARVPGRDIGRGLTRDLDRDLGKRERIWQVPGGFVVSNLARHPRWGGGSLRAFRWAGVRDLE